MNVTLICFESISSCDAELVMVLAGVYVAVWCCQIQMILEI